MSVKAADEAPAWMRTSVPPSVQPAAPAPKQYVNHADAVAQLAPPAMPCFDSRDQWLEYLKSAAEHQRERHVAQPLIFRKGHPVEFNYHFFACVDCDAKHAAAMWRVGRCKPAYLLNLPEAQQAKESSDV